VMNSNMSQAVNAMTLAELPADTMTGLTPTMIASIANQAERSMLFIQTELDIALKILTSLIPVALMAT